MTLPSRAERARGRELVVTLPTLHAGQVAAFQSGTRFTALRCGRRWGKTEFGSTLSCDGATKGESIGFFAPDYKILLETYTIIRDVLESVTRSANQGSGVIRLINGGRIDFWSLENERAGRSRKYHKVILDEAAFTKANMIDIWRKSIRPTLLDYRGRAWALSTPAGISQENFFWQVCNEKEHGFSDFHAPTSGNPYLPLDELDRLEKENHPLVYKQEYLAEFVDWSGVQFFDIQKMLQDGQPVADLARCDAVIAVIDTASKDSLQHDGTAVTYWAINRIQGHKMVLLDWDIVQIEGALLETWLPTVFQNLQNLAVQYKARNGSLGAWIEDKASGTILLQQAARRGWAAHPIDGAITASGKDGRALSVSGYVYRGHVKMTQHAFDKVVPYKNHTRNHFMTQVFGFRIGIKDQEDDLLDSFCYAIAISLGNQQGF